MIKVSPKRGGFTLVELLVVLSAVGVLMVVFPVVVGLNTPRKPAYLMKEAVNLRNIHAAMCTYGATNKDFFPGLSGKGDYISTPLQGRYYGAMPNARHGQGEVDGTGCTLSAGTNLALAQLLEEACITPAQMISPGETNMTSQGEPKVSFRMVEPNAAANQPVVPDGNMAFEGPKGEVKDFHCSHALLAYGRQSLRPEWRSNQNQQAIVLSTRLIFGQSPEGFGSVWADGNGGKWKGSMVRGDSSTVSESFSAGQMGDVFGILKYGERVVPAARTQSSNVIGVFGRSTSMENFGATEQTGMVGSMGD